MRMLPAPSGTGIVFRRTDLDGFEIEAVSRNVARVSYATSLMKKGRAHLDHRARAVGIHRRRHR